jgi:dTDP-4-dehydrorhamnose 3,5-epimerase
MNVTALSIADVKLIAMKKFGDARGFFSETYNANALAEAGIDAAFVQDNHSLSAARGVVRGLHYQIGEAAQGKLVRVVAGAILDVAVDIRRGSPTFGKYVAAEISAEKWNQIYVPVGFAHGFMTLVPDTQVIYKVTTPYAPAAERGIAWNDPALAIDWGIGDGEATLSDRDRKHPPLAGQKDLF